MPAGRWTGVAPPAWPPEVVAATRGTAALTLTGRRGGTVTAAAGFATGAVDGALAGARLPGIGGSVGGPAAAMAGQRARLATTSRRTMARGIR